LLEALDPPDPYVSTPQRNVTTTPMQSLVMINGPYVMQRARALATRLEKQHGTAPAAWVTAAYRVVYSREPTPAEKERAISFLSTQGKGASKQQSDPEGPSSQQSDSENSALVDF